MVAGIGRIHNDPVQHKSTLSEKAGRHAKGDVVDDQHPLKLHQQQKQQQQQQQRQQKKKHPQPRQHHGAIPGQEMGTDNGTTAVLATRNHNQTKQLQVNTPKRRFVLRPPHISSSNNNCNSLQQQIAGNIDAEESQEEEQLMVAGILEGIASLCLGPIDPLTNPVPTSSTAKGRQRDRRKRENKIQVESSSNSSRPRRSSSLISDSVPDLLPGPSKKKRVVYPIASYGGKLNSQKLISERRQVFQQNLFRPVSNDEMSMRL